MMQESVKLYEKIRDNHKVEDATGHEFYTPSRNLVFSTLAAMIGEIAGIAEGLKEVKVGLGIHTHSDVYSRDYWDITPEFVQRLNNVFALNDSMQVSIYAPYAEVLKSEIVKDAVRMGVPYELTWTCYNPVKSINQMGEEYKPCLKCEACQERARAGEAAGVGNINSYSLTIEY
jgi:7-cyano-7-deazaguanine synthase